MRRRPAGSEGVVAGGGTFRPGAALLPAALLLLAAPGALRALPPERVETYERDGVELVVRATPGGVALDRELHLTLRLRHPDGLEVTLPADFRDRLEGFALLGQYEDEPLTAGTQRLRTVHLRARPLPAADRYRLAPFAVRWTDPGEASAQRWFPTRPMLFEKAPLLGPAEPAPGDVEEAATPRWVRPSSRALARTAALAAAVLALLALCAWAGRWMLRRVRLARMTPRERALRELDELLRRDLHGRGRVKRFYIELTHVVRRYVERRYAIRAPELTTGEFLREAGRSEGFPRATLTRLREFLDAADRIKFAGAQATPAQTEASIRTAREYLLNEPPTVNPGEVRHDA